MAPPRQAQQPPPIPIPLGVSLLRSTAKVVSVIALFLMLFNSAHAGCYPGFRPNAEGSLCVPPVFIPGSLPDFTDIYDNQYPQVKSYWVDNAAVTIPAGSAVRYDWSVTAAIAAVEFIGYSTGTQDIFVVIYEDDIVVQEWGLNNANQITKFTHISKRSAVQGRWKLALVNWSANEQTVSFVGGVCSVKFSMACSADAIAGPNSPTFAQAPEFSTVGGNLECPNLCPKDAFYWKQSASTAKDCVKLNHLTEETINLLVVSDQANQKILAGASMVFPLDASMFASLPPGTAIRTDLTAYRSDTLRISMPSNTMEPNPIPDLWVHIFENGVAIDMFPAKNGAESKEYKAAGKGPSNGFWQVSVSNWVKYDGFPQALFFESITVTLTCSTDADFFANDDGITTCLPGPVCTAGTRLNAQKLCVSPTFDFILPLSVVSSWPPRDGHASHLLSYQWQGGFVPINAMSAATFEWPIRADYASFEFETNSEQLPDLWAAIYENDVFVDEWHFANSATQKFTFAAAASANAAGRGKWSLRLVNWANSQQSLMVMDDRLIMKADFMCTAGAKTSRDPLKDLDFYRDGTVPNYSEIAVSKCPPKLCALNKKYWKNPEGQADCVEVNHVTDATTALAVTVDEDKKKVFSGVAGEPFSLAPGRAIRTDLTGYRSDTLQLSIEGASQWPDMWVHVFENGVAIDNFNIIEGTKGGPKSYKAKGNGLWQVSTAHWGQGYGYYHWFSSRMEVTLTCNSNSDFVTNAQGVNTCIPIPVCAAGTRLNAENACVEPDFVGTFGGHAELNGGWAPTHDHQPSYLFSYKWADTAQSFAGAIVPPLSARTFEWSDIRPLFAKFELQAQAGVSPDVWVAIYKNDVFVQEWQASATTTKFTLAANDGGNSVWKIALVNWGTTIEQALTPADVTIIVDLTCKAASTYDGLYKNPARDLDFYRRQGLLQCPTKACPMDAKFTQTDCVQVNHVSDRTIFFQPPAGGGTNKKILNGGGGGANSEYNLLEGQAIRTDLEGYRSDTLELTVTKAPSIKDLWVHVFENGVAIDMFPLSTWDVSKTYKAAGQGPNNGLWQVTVANWNDHKQFFTYNRIAVTLSCELESDFAVDTSVFAQGVASCLYVPCVDPSEHRVAGTCLKPTLAKDGPDVTTFLVVPVTSSDTELKFVGSTSDPVEVKPRQGGAVADFVTYRADTLKVKVAKQVAPTLFVRVYENGKLVGGGEFSATVAGVVQTFTATQEQQTHRRRTGQVLSTTEFGVWSVAVVNWAVGDAPVSFAPDSLEISLSCASGEQFTTVGGIQSCLPFVSPPPTPPPPATTCGYTSAVGFNVWARWNVFTLGNAVVDGGSVSGRIGATGTVSAINAAHVHTTKEAFISAQENHAAGGPWSITAKGAVTLTGTNAQTRTQVSNGGVESAATVTATHATVEDDKIKPEQALSADVDDAAEYFTERSTVWSLLAPSSIETDIAAKEISVQLHGKVNVVADEGLTVAELGAIEKITLTGNPSGTVIINVKGPGTAVLSPKLQVTYQGRGGASSATPESPTFGRVVLNLVDATGLQLDAPATAGTPTPIVHVSILAPKAVASFAVGAPEVRGNVVVKALTAHNDLSVQPFGTLARRSPLPPAPKRAWTSAGRSATACLWHTL